MVVGRKSHCCSSDEMVHIQEEFHGREVVALQVGTGSHLLSGFFSSHTQTPFKIVIDMPLLKYFAALPLRLEPVEMSIPGQNRLHLSLRFGMHQEQRGMD